MDDRAFLLLLSTLVTGACFNPELPGDAMTDPAATDATTLGDSSGGPSEPESSGEASSGGVADDATTGELPEDIDFEETFDADVGAWEFRDDPGVTVPGRWTYAGGDLVQDADVAGPDEVGPALGTHAIGGDPDWDAYVVEVSYEVDDDGVVGVSCHVGGPGDWTRLELDHDDGWARLLRSDGGTVVVLDEFQVLTPPVALGVEHLLSLECGTTYRGFVDAVAYLQAPGDAEREGAVGMFASQTGEGVTGVRFHWIEVSDDVE